jgi:hypothetical protein
MNRDHDDKALHSAYWQERTPGGFTLVVDGRERGIAHTDYNTGVILSDTGQPGYKFVSAESRVIFDEVEHRVGITSPIREFRTAHGGKAIIPWRSMSEKRAAAFRAECPKDFEAERYARTAWEKLNKKTPSEALNPKSNDARFLLASALIALERDKGRWSEEPRRLLEAARDALRQAPEKDDQQFQVSAKLACERAVSSLEGAGVDHEPQKRTHSVREGGEETDRAPGGWKSNTATRERELRETLEQAHKALTEIAQTKGLDSDGERAREMCAQALEKLGHGERRGRTF